MMWDLVTWMACPDCRGAFILEPFSAGAGQEVEEGLLICQGCRAFYPVAAGIPRVLSRELYPLEPFAARHPRALEAAASRHPPKADWVPLPGADGHADLKRSTAESFGLEWERWANLGWGDHKTIEQEEGTFFAKALVNGPELAGKLILDAGCGNGRFTYHAARLGRDVVGVDLSAGVDVTRRHLRGLPNVHLVQADLFRLPFREEVFDLIYSIGVLMHTGDARKAFAGLVRHLRPGGSITVHVYHRGNLLFEFNDRLLRGISTRIAPSRFLPLAGAVAWVARRLPRKVVGVIDSFVRIDRHPVCVFDWYTAPAATRHTYPEVYGWFEEEGIRRVADGYRGRSWLTHVLWPGRAVTVRGVRPGPAA